jgi:hypothetical protein
MFFKALDDRHIGSRLPYLLVTLSNYYATMYAPRVIDFSSQWGDHGSILENTG